MLTEHIESHVYSLQDVFHPESPLVATVVSAATDSTLEPSDDVDNWGVVWAEAMLIPPVVYTSSAVTSVSTFGDTPTNMHVMQETRPLQGSVNTQNQSIQQEGQQTHENSSTNSSIEYTAKEYISDYLSLPNFLHFDLIFGLPLTIGAVASTFAMELAGTIVYCLAIGFWYASSVLPLSSTGPLLWIFYFVFLLLSGIFMMLDSLFLILSVGLTELFAFLGGTLTFLTGGFRSAISWHQYIRRLCHLYRWAWRKSQSKLTPNRSFLLMPMKNSISNSSVSGSQRNNDIEMLSQISHQERGNLVIYEHDADDITDGWNTLSNNEIQRPIVPTTGR